MLFLRFAYEDIVEKVMARSVRLLSKILEIGNRPLESAYEDQMDSVQKK